MITLIFVACLATVSPVTCDSYEFTYRDISKKICDTHAQVALASWAGEHPGYRIRGWKCVETDKLGSDA